VIVKANTGQAEKQMKEVQREYLDNPLLNTGCQRIIEQSAQCFLLDVVDPSTGKGKRVRIEAYGRGAAIRGLAAREGRPKIVIIDDPQDIGDMKSDTILSDDFLWYDSDVKYLGAETRVFMIGNNLGEKCLIERVITDAENLRYKTMRIPIADEDFTKAAWPEKFSLEFIKDERERNKRSNTLANWYRERMCVAISEETRMFSPEHFQYYPFVARGKITSGLNVYIRMDPAVGLNDVHDPSVILVAGFNADSHLFVLDAAFGHWKPKEKLDHAFRLISKWQPMNFGVENSKEGQLFVQSMREEMCKRNVFTRIIEVKHGNKQKVARIEQLQPRFAEHTIWFPDRRSEWVDRLEVELLAMTKEGSKGLHDDFPDTLAYFLQGTNKPSGYGMRDTLNEKHKDLPRNSIGDISVV
jgi:predicted phage terminase large subunit-like protein